MPSLAEALEARTVEAAPELVETIDKGRIRCYACGHECKIPDGALGVCKVRFNRDGKLYVPWGYVGGIQCDPVEKKPFFHARPGALAFSFGMLGCDLHCSYCFTGDTVVVTDRGPIPFERLFESTPRTTVRSDAEIAFPEETRAIAASGQPRTIRGVFRHHYRGRVAIIRPYYLPALRCTPDHRVYATSDPATAPAPLRAEELTTQHYLAIPLSYEFSSTQTVDVATELVIETDRYHLVPIRSVENADFEGPVYNMEV